MSKTKVASREFQQVRHLYNNSGSADLAQHHLFQLEKQVAVENQPVLMSSVEEARKMVAEMKAKEQNAKRS